MKSILIKAVLLLLLCSLQACGIQYSAQPIEAWVVDDETGKPLEGVIVVAHWQLEGGLEGGNSFGQMMIMETVTVAKGRFYFPAWGPKSVPMKLLINPATSNARLKGMDPEMYFFKHGYNSLTLWNKRTTEQTMFAGPAVRSSDWNGKTIKLKTFPESENQYEMDLSNLRISLRFAYYGEQCEWKSVPRMIAALSREHKRLQAKGVYSGLISIEAMVATNEKTCGSPREYFRKHGYE